MRLPNGYGSVHKMGGNRRNPYRARVTDAIDDEGRQLYRVVGYYPSQRAALLALALYNDNPCALGTETITFEEVYRLWAADRFRAENRGLHGRSKASEYAYSGAFANALPLHKRKFYKLTAADLQAVMDGCLLRKESRNNLKGLWSYLYRYAMKYGMVNRDAAELVDVGNREVDGEAKVTRAAFSGGEIAALEALGATDGPLREAADSAMIMIYAGMRVSELLGMRTENIHIEERYMVGGVKTKAGKNRVIPISRKIEDAVRRCMEGRGFLLGGTRAISRDAYVRSYWAPLMEHMGAEHLPHDCRYTCASLLDRAGANKIAVKRILGHSEGDVTEHYTHKALADLTEAIDLI